MHIFHRDFLWSPTIEVSLTTEDDMDEVLELIDHVENKEEIKEHTLEAIHTAAEGRLPFTVFCNEEIIGLFVITKSVNLEFYKSHFCIQDYIFMN